MKEKIKKERELFFLKQPLRERKTQPNKKRKGKEGLSLLKRRKKKPTNTRFP